LKSCDRILEAQKIIILEKIEGDRIFRVIENIEEIRYASHGFVHQVPSTCEICLVKKTPYASQYPGVYVFTTPARMARPVTNLALQQVILLKNGQGQNRPKYVMSGVLINIEFHFPEEVS